MTAMKHCSQRNPVSNRCWKDCTQTRERNYKTGRCKLYATQCATGRIHDPDTQRRCIVLRRWLNKEGYKKNTGKGGKKKNNTGKGKAKGKGKGKGRKHLPAPKKKKIPLVLLPSPPPTPTTPTQTRKSKSRSGSHSHSHSPPALKYVTPSIAHLKTSKSPKSRSGSKSPLNSLQKLILAFE